MPHDYTPEQQRQYDEAAAALDAAANPATTARGDDGRFAPTPAPAEPAAAPAAAPASEPAATDKPADPPADAAPGAETAKPADPLAEALARAERAEKMARDNQVAFTRAAQEAAALKRAQEQRDRDASKPTILETNPDLADAIRYVTSDPAPQHQAAERAQVFQSTIEKVHPDAFSTDMAPELQEAIAAAWEGLGTAAQDPLEVVRVITQEKLAFHERQVGKRFAAEAARQQEKSAMSVPGAGKSSVAAAPADAALAEVKRIQNMSDADFAKEVRRVKGY